MKLKLSALDQGPIESGKGASEALQDTIKLAKALDELGYKRFWVSEHHNTKALASSSPEVLISAIAANTKNIRVGSGGVMLPHYSAYKVSENFRVLEALYPNRIDLGIGRAPGGMLLSTKALQKGKNLYSDNYEEQTKELIKYLYDIDFENDEFRGLRATPQIETVPEIYVLGSSGGSAGIAAKYGLNYGYARFITGDMAIDSIDWYRENFEKTIVNEKPRSIVCTFAICGKTEEEANNLAKVMDYALAKIESGVLNGIPKLEDIKDYEYTEIEKRIIRRNRSRMTVGTPKIIKEQFENIAKKHNVDEFMILTLNTDLEKKIESYRLIMEEFKK